MAVGGAGLYLVPAIAFARFEQVNEFLNEFIRIVNNTLVPLVFALAFLLFLWGIFKFFFWGGGDEGKREEGRQLMLWAIIAFLLMVSIWGIVNLLSRGLGFSSDRNLENIPNVPTRGNQQIPI